MKVKHPIQPLELDDHGVLRFKDNPIVRYLLEKGPIDMNHIAMQGFSREDQCQFAQLIGYSHSGSSDLSYVDDETWYSAQKVHEDGLTEDKARIESLTEELDRLKKVIRECAEALGEY